MPLPELQLRDVEKHLDAYCNTVPEHARCQLRMGYVIKGNTVILYEERPLFRDKAQWRAFEVAQFRYIRTVDRWRLFYKDQHSKWHIYGGVEDAERFEDLLKEVVEDPTCIFWG